MFESVQPPRWPPKRPERSGFLTISIFCITVTFGFVARDHILVNSKHPESKNTVAPEQDLEPDKRPGMDVEIIKMGGDSYSARAEAGTHLQVSH